MKKSLSCFWLIPFIPGAEWMTRHNDENQVISSGSSQRLKQITYFSRIIPTAELTANIQKSPCFYCSGWEQVFPILGFERVVEAISQSLDTLPQVLCRIADIH